MNKLPVFYQKSKPCNISIAKGFATKFASPSSRFEEFAGFVAGCSKKKIFTAMAVINGIVYSVASEAKVLGRSANKERLVNRGRLNRLVKTGWNVLATSVKGLSAYVKAHWKMASSYRPGIRAIRDELHELKLIKAVETRQHSRSWSVFLDIDFAGLLYLYELLESALMDYYGLSIEELPEHRGALIKMLYDTASKLMGRRYRRTLPEGVIGRDRWGYIYRDDHRLAKQEEIQPSCQTQNILTATLPTPNAPLSISDTQGWFNPILREGMSPTADQ